MIIDLSSNSVLKNEPALENDTSVVYATKDIVLSLVMQGCDNAPQGSSNVNNISVDVLEAFQISSSL